MNRTLLLTLILWGTLSQAGIRIINHGGGYAEMKALSALSRLQYFVSLCVQRPDICGLGLEEIEKLQSLESYFSTRDAELEFFTDTRSTDIFRYNDGRPNYLGISSQTLYAPDGSPKKFGEIAAIVFNAWTGRPGLQQTNLEWMAKALTRLEIEESELYLGGQTKLHAPRITNSQHSFSIQLLMLENQIVTKDLTARLTANLPCAGTAAELVSVSGLSFRSPFILGRAQWRCGEQTKEGRFAIDLSGGEDPNLMKVVVSSVKESRGCDGRMSVKPK